jgi:hypothetical protein
MGFFRGLLRILTFGLLGKERSPEEVYVRERLAQEKEKKEALARKQLEERRTKLLKAKK